MKKKKHSYELAQQILLPCLVSRLSWLPLLPALQVGLWRDKEVGDAFSLADHTTWWKQLSPHYPSMLQPQNGRGS